jgi:hypothetical protein
VLLFDMEEVRKVTSFGVREWLEGLKSLRAEYYGFARCRPAVVAQFNMVSGFLGRGQVLSLYAPYTCPECNQELEQLLDLRSQFPLLAARELPLLRCPSCGVDAIFDDLPDSYFSFLLAPPSPPPLALALLSSLTGLQPLAQESKRPAAYSTAGYTTVQPTAQAQAPISSPGLRAQAPISSPGLRAQGTATSISTAIPRVGGPTSISTAIPRVSGPTSISTAIPRVSEPLPAHLRKVTVPMAVASPPRPRILLVEKSEEHIEQLAQLVRVLGRVEVQREVPAAGAWKAGIINLDALTAEEKEQLFAAPPVEPHNLILYTQDPTRSTMVGALERLGLAQVLANNDGVDGEELYITLHKLLSGEVFGLDKYFSWGARAVQRKLQSSEEKQEAIETAIAFAQDAGLQQRLVDLFSLVAEELLTNALYDAPTNAKGEHRFAHYARSRAVHLSPGEEICMTLCCDGRRIGISVLDPFGSLEPGKIASYLVKCFRKGDNQVDRKEGGAGLGLFYALEAVSHLSAGIEPGRSTELLGLVDLRGTYRDFAAKGKSLTVFRAE